MKQCPYTAKCGGCDYQGVAYNEQLRIKQEYVKKLFPNIEVQQTIGMNDPYNYRHKIYATFSSDKKGKVSVGMYEENTHKVIQIDNCQIQNTLGNDIINALLKIVIKEHIQPYNEDKQIGYIRHCYLRINSDNSEVLMTLVCGQKVFPGINNIVKALRKEFPQIKTIITNFNNRKTSVVLGDKEKVVYGKGYIIDRIDDLSFQISSKSFYQVNPSQATRLYHEAIKLGEIKNKVVFDTYCGIGTISLLCAKEAKEVLGVEINSSSIRNAIENAKHNKINNTSFYLKDASEFMRTFKRENYNIDVVFVDPPRSGCDEIFLNALLKLNAPKIVYISCNPETQAKDYKLLKKNYEITKCQPVDMFPFCKHIENILVLEAKKPIK